MRTPAWAKGEQRPLLEAEGEKLRQDVASERLNVRGLVGVHSDRDRARVELSEEQRVRKASRPSSRRWRELAKHDERIDALIAKQADATQQRVEGEARLAEAPGDDARSLANWSGDGERGPRPEATIYERQRDVDAARLLVEAVGVELDQALEQRVRFIEKNRAKMLADARKDIEQAQAQLTEAVSRLPALRQQLIDSREALLWTGSFPNPIESYGFPTAVALGLQEPVRQTLHTTARIEYGALVRLLELDGEALAGRFSASQRRQLGEDIDGALTPADAAMWASDERAKAWGRAEVERARQLGEYAANVGSLAEEVRDIRPD